MYRRDQTEPKPFKQSPRFCKVAEEFYISEMIVGEILITDKFKPPEYPNSFGVGFCCRKDGCITLFIQTGGRLPLCHMKLNPPQSQPVHEKTKTLHHHNAAQMQSNMYVFLHLLEAGKGHKEKRKRLCSALRRSLHSTPSLPLNPR